MHITRLVERSIYRNVYEEAEDQPINSSKRRSGAWCM